jgi:hypothetical protein
VLEIVDVPQHGRKTGYMAADSATYKKGTMVVLSGTFSSSDITALPAGQKNSPGWAQAGYPKLVRAWAGSGGRAFPIDKYEFESEYGSDGTADAIDGRNLDTVLKGQAVTYFRIGTFRTTEFTDVGSAVFGNFLKCSASGTLTIEAAANTETGNSVARVEKLINPAGDAKYHRLEFTLISGEA